LPKTPLVEPGRAARRHRADPPDGLGQHGRGHPPGRGLQQAQDERAADALAVEVAALDAQVVQHGRVLSWRACAQYSTRVPPAGPRGQWLLGNLREFSRDQLGFYARCAREYGDVVPIRLARARGLMVYHPDAIEEVLVVRSRDFTKTQGIRLLRALVGDGLFLAEGELWLRQRRLMQPAFHRQRIAAYGDVMTAYATRQADGWQDGAVLEIHDEMMAVTRDVVARTLFDADVSDDDRAIAAAAHTASEYFGSRLGSLLQLVPMWVPTPANLEVRRAIRRLDEVVFRMIAARRRDPRERGDLLSLLLHARDADDGSRMSDRQVRDEVMTLFLAGHETTAVALSWTWYLLAQHPEADARLADELRTVLGGRPPTVADLPALRYTEHVVTESMRLYPPAYGLSRRAATATEIAGQRLAAGDFVLMPTWVVQRDARWFDKPEAFRPERWADDLARRLPRFAYFPFGGGPRQCIGNTFATMETVLILATLAQRFRLTLVPGQAVRPVPYITLRPEPGLRMRLTRR
jgi:cytochrome P450